MIRVLTVVGARPQFIKAAAVSRALACTGEISEEIVHTGQHYDDAMSGAFFRELEIPEPVVNLEVGSGQHGEQTGRMLAGIERKILDRKPDWVLVYGDTNSTAAAALAAVKQHVPVAHVEAGLRSFNRRMPEEINRIVADHVSDLLFAPTQTAVNNLAAEGISGQKVALVGDVMYDAALFAAESAPLTDPRLMGRAYVCATVHRAENTDDPDRLLAILDGLDQSGMPVALPVHPRTRATLEEHGRTQWASDRFVLLDPLPYKSMAAMVKGAAVVATDSGGLQKEAFFHGVPCVTLRDETEWVELVELGWNRLVPPRSASTIAEEIRAAVGRTGRAGQPYGEGDAATKVAAALVGASLANAVS